jgi:hypothetical protein
LLGRTAAISHSTQHWEHRYSHKKLQNISQKLRIKPVKKILVVKIPRSAEVLQAFQLRFYVLDCVIAALLRSLLLQQKQ